MDHCFSCGLQGLATRPSAGQCEGCHHLRYCSEVCQRQDWEKGGHEQECDSLIGIVASATIFGAIFGIAGVLVVVKMIADSIESSSRSTSSTSPTPAVPKEFKGKWTFNEIQTWVDYALNIWLFEHLDSKEEIFSRKDRQKHKRDYSHYRPEPGIILTADSSRLFEKYMRAVFKQHFSVAGLKSSASFTKETEDMTEHMTKSFTKNLNNWMKQEDRAFVKRWKNPKELATARSFLEIISKSMFNVIRAWHQELRQELKSNEDTPKLMTRSEIDHVFGRIKNLQQEASADARNFTTWFTLGKVMPEYPKWWISLPRYIWIDDLSRIDF